MGQWERRVPGVLYTQGRQTVGLAPAALDLPCTPTSTRGLAAKPGAATLAEERAAQPCSREGTLTPAWGRPAWGRSDTAPCRAAALLERTWVPEVCAEGRAWACGSRCRVGGLATRQGAPASGSPLSPRPILPGALPPAQVTSQNNTNRNNGAKVASGSQRGRFCEKERVCLVRPVAGATDLRGVACGRPSLALYQVSRGLRAALYSRVGCSAAVRSTLENGARGEPQASRGRRQPRPPQPAGPAP